MNINSSAFLLLIGLVPIIAFGPGCDKEVDFIAGCLHPMKRHETFSFGTGAQNADPRPCMDMGSAELLHFSANLHGDTAPRSDSELPNYDQVNKLFGFNDCGNSGDPQNDSARVGWYFHDGKMEVLPYVDHDYEHHYDLKNPLAQIDLDRTYEYEIRIDGDHYRFTIIDDTGKTLNEISVARYCPPDQPGKFSPRSKFALLPYFGGRSPAPHPMHIDVNLLR
jgi:hypothetical protein